VAAAEQPRLVLLSASDPAAAALAARELLGDEPGLAVVAAVPGVAVEATAAALSTTHAVVVASDGAPAALAQVVAAALRLRSANRERDGARAAAELLLAGNSTAVRRLRSQLERLARTPRSTVLILGREADGVGEAAQLLHARSPRGAGPFVDVRARELVPGSTPGSLDAALGDAEGGTLHLREVTELEPGAQTRLVAHLEERRGAHADDEEPRAPDTRIVASTRSDLADVTVKPSLRDDLVYRLNVLTLRVPSLPEREDDVPDLSARVLSGAAQGSGAPRGFSVTAMDALRAHSFTGGLVELRARVELAASVATGRDIRPEDLGLAEPVSLVRAAERGSPLPDDDGLPLTDRSLEALEEALIRRVLREERGNKSRAARVLGVHRATLYNKLKRYDIETGESGATDE
jgi:DNA-binding NtrC family response regulator